MTAANPRTVVYRNARIIDPANGRDEIADLLTQDKNIAAVGINLIASNTRSVDDRAAGRRLQNYGDSACCRRSRPHNAEVASDLRIDLTTLITGKDRNEI